MASGADRLEADRRPPDQRLCVRLIDEGGPMAAADQFSGKRREWVEVTWKRRRDEREMGQSALRSAEIMMPAFSARGITTRRSQAAEPRSATRRPIRP